MIDKIKDFYKRSKVTAIFLTIMLGYFVFLSLNGGSTDSYTLAKYGAFFPPIIKEYGEYYRFISSIFIHIGLSHIFFNSYALTILGPQLEYIMGGKKYFLFFLLTGFFGNLATYVFNFNSLSAGASGSLFGLLGAMLFLTRKYKDFISPQVKNSILQVVGINLVLTIVVPSISVTAHLGGLISGFLLSFIFFK